MPTRRAQQRAQEIGCSYPHVIPVDPARALVDAVRRGDQIRAQRVLRRPDLPRIAFALAERCAGLRPLEPCGTRSAAERHIANGEPVDEQCATARRRYYRDVRRAQRAARARDAALPNVYGEPEPHNPVVVRAWARSNGIDVPARGRLRTEVLAAYRAAQSEAGVA